MFLKVSFSVIPMLLPRNSRLHPKTGSSYILACVVVFEGYLSRLLCFADVALGLGLGSDRLPKGNT